MRNSLVMGIAGALAFAFAMTPAAFAKGPGGGGPPGLAGKGAFASGSPHGFASGGNRTGWTGNTPPGWSHGKKKGWGCTPGSVGCKPPGLRR